MYDTRMRIAAGAVSLLMGVAVAGGLAIQSAQAASSMADQAADWTMDSDCESCHETEAKSYSKKKALMKTHESLACTMCHDDEEALTEVHTTMKGNAKAPKHLSETEVSPEVCMMCHADLAAIAANTDDVLVDDEETAFNPHLWVVRDDTDDADEAEEIADEDADEAADEDVACPFVVVSEADDGTLVSEDGTVYATNGVPGYVEKHEGINCTSCHNMHSNNTAVAQATATCGNENCHHKNVYRSCGSCHQ